MSSSSNRRHVFISHHHNDDAHVTKMTDLLARNGHDIRNSSIRMKPANQRRFDQGRVSDRTIERVLRMKISWASTVVVLIGKQTHSRPWVNWELNQANKQGKRIVGVYCQGATEADIPPAFEKYGSSVVGWNADRIIAAVDGENNFERPDGSKRSPVNAGSNSIC
jgi:hypothetical protein